MSSVRNAIAGVVGAAILTTNSFFAGTEDNAVLMANNTTDINTASNSNNSIVTAIEAAPSEGIDLSGYLSNVSEGIETAVENSSKQEDILDSLETDQESNVDAMTTGAAPPNDNNDDNDDDTTAKATSGNGTGGSDDDGDDDTGGDDDGGDDDGDSD